MRPLTLQSRITLNYTLVPDYFLDNYMPKASGEFVKIYLYILRCLGSGTPAAACDVLKNGCASYSGSDDCFCVSFLADRLNLTENDVMRALKYWENEGLLILTYANASSGSGASDGELTGITLADITMSVEDTFGTAANETAVTSQTTAPAAMISAPEVSVPEASVPEKPSYTAAQLKEFAANEELSQLLYIAQMYLGKTLTATETNSMIFFYDTLKMSADVIEYLLEYCISKEHRSMRYIEKVAIDWAEHGISSLKDAREYSDSKSEDMFAVMNAFGITGRSAAKVERDYIRKWRETYGFNTDIIVEAC
ncbi:MAG TPA: DNA replication protein DnaD, partial [Bacteroides sp.]|nr:DNA replication protein DnaD [Bacteroides sp.]